MSRSRRSFLQNRIASFKPALAGLQLLLRTQPNAWIHSVAAVGVLILGAVFSISRFEWILILAAIALVFITELFNTAIELLCDLVQPEYDPVVKKIKDLSAAAVLVAAGFSVAVACIVFYKEVG